jgi:hypothetical protein
MTLLELAVVFHQLPRVMAHGHGNAVPRVAHGLDGWVVLHANSGPMPLSSVRLPYLNGRTTVKEKGGLVEWWPSGCEPWLRRDKSGWGRCQPGTTELETVLAAQASPSAVRA